MQLLWVCNLATFVALAQGALAQMPTGAIGQQQQSIGPNQSITAAILTPATGLPYRALKLTRSVQKLSDGTVITHETKGLFARDGEARVREDLYLVHSGQMSGHQHAAALQSVTVGDPVSHTVLIWTGENTKIAMKMALPNLGQLNGGAMPAVLSAPPPPPPRVRTPALAASQTPSISLGTEQQDVHTEQLGQQSMEGILATGVRTTTTILLGKIGNDRPMTVVHEEWRSPELKILVKTFDSDPRTGEQTMELTELVRTEPDKALFQAPVSFKVIDMADMIKSLGTLGKTQ